MAAWKRNDVFGWMRGSSLPAPCGFWPAYIFLVCAILSAVIAVEIGSGTVQTNRVFGLDSGSTSALIFDVSDRAGQQELVVSDFYDPKISSSTPIVADFLVEWKLQVTDFRIFSRVIPVWYSFDVRVSKNGTRNNPLDVCLQDVWRNLALYYRQPHFVDSSLRLVIPVGVVERLRQVEAPLTESRWTRLPSVITSQAWTLASGLILSGCFLSIGLILWRRARHLKTVAYRKINRLCVRCAFPLNEGAVRCSECGEIGVVVSQSNRVSS